MKAIKIKFVPTSNKRPARLRADDGEGHSLTENYTYDNLDQQAFELAKKLIKKTRVEGISTGNRLLQE